MRYAVIVAGVVAVAGAGWWLAAPRPPAPPDVVAPVSNPGDVGFEDVAARAGVTFTHFDPATLQHLMPETMGSGLGWVDYDADGWPDLFCVQGGPLPPASDPAKTHRLYRNNRDGTFADVTAAVGLDRSGFGVGCAVGDYDNDGFDDLAVTYLGGVELWHNVADPAAPGGRKFLDVTAAAKLAGTNPHWATSAAWADLDGDARLDLYVCNYVEVDPAKPLTCVNPEKKLHYQCSPTAFPYTPHRLYRNRGDGTFDDATAAVTPPALAPGLGVVAADFDADGKVDLYVANDMNPAYLFANLGGMAFRERALPGGCGLGPGGARIAGMGVAAADLDGSGRPSLFVTNFQASPNVLFRNRGGLRFDDMSYPSGLGGPSLPVLGFGACAADFDLDGRPDLAVANGHVQRVAREVYGVPYAQECQLFLGDGAGRFRDGTATAGADFVKPRVGRGLASADFDNDGKPDLALSGVGERAAVFRNRTETANGWLALDLVGDGVKSNRNAVGAVVTIEAGGAKQTHFVVGGGSYLSASDRRVHAGLGGAAAAAVTVRWPSGAVQTFRDLPARTRWRLREGVAAAEAVR